MADGSRQKIKVGVREGGGPPPGYQWNVTLIDHVVSEGFNVLSEIGYEHIAGQFRILATSADPSRSNIVDVRSIGDGDDKVYEIRDKGHVFGGANVRVLFGIDHVTRSIVPLAAFKKQKNGHTPVGVLVTARRRWRLYKCGDLGLPFPE